MSDAFKFRNDVPSGRLTIVSRCPNCGVMVQNLPPPDGYAAEYDKLGLAQGEYNNGTVSTIASTVVSMLAFFACQACRANWAIGEHFTLHWEVCLGGAHE